MPQPTRAYWRPPFEKAKLSGKVKRIGDAMEAFSYQFIIFSFVAVVAYLALRAFSVKRTAERGAHWWRIWMLASAVFVVVLRRSGAAAPRIFEIMLWPRA